MSAAEAREHQKMVKITQNQAKRENIFNNM
jgi:hypothetical protein